MAIDQQRRLQDAAAQAHSAQDRGDHAAANEAWRRYRRRLTTCGRALMSDASTASRPICSLDDLVAMKRATGRGADLVDLERLRDAHGELPDH